MKNRPVHSPRVPRPELMWSAHKGYGWTDQFHRMDRWHKRMINAKGDDFLDYSTAFFQACYHMKDWIEETGTLEKEALDKFFKDEFPMRVCRDICNAAKHFTLRQTPSLGRECEFSMAWEFNGSGKDLVILTGGEKISVLKVAGLCVTAWRRFVKEHKIGTILPQEVQEAFDNVRQRRE